jgi:hypothetical protein
MSQLITQPQEPPTEAPAKHRWYLRAWFIVPAVLVVVAAAVLAVLFTLPKTITVRGTVVDQLRPDLGVAAAALKADGKTGKTGATGAFTMTGVPHDAKLQVAAPAYGPTTVSASTHQMTIRLVPIPVSVTVTSAMTGAKLNATVTAPPGAQAPYAITSGGTVRLYRAAPGETMTVKAPGYLPAQKAVASDRTLAVALEPGLAIQRQQIAVWVSSAQYTKVVDWVLRPATGYTFLPPTAQEQAEMNKTVNPEFEVYYTGRAIAEPDAWVGIAIDKPDTTWDIQTDVNENLGHAARVTLAGQPAWHGGPAPEGFYGTMTKAGAIDLEVYGDSTAQTDQIMTNILNKLLARSNAAAA